MVYLTVNLFYKHPYDWNMLFISMVLMVPVAIDGFTQYFGPRESTNTLRFITGLSSGFNTGVIIGEYLKKALHSRM